MPPTNAPRDATGAHCIHTHTHIIMIFVIAQLFHCSQTKPIQGMSNVCTGLRHRLLLIIVVISSSSAAAAVQTCCTCVRVHFLCVCGFVSYQKLSFSLPPLLRCVSSLPVSGLSFSRYQRAYNARSAQPFRRGNASQANFYSFNPRVYYIQIQCPGIAEHRRRSLTEAI